jgi:hypothetical protein
MGSGLGHTPGVARGAHGGAFAGAGDQRVVTALVASCARKAVGQDAARQFAAQLALGRGRDALILPVVATQSQEGLHVALRCSLRRRIGGVVPAVSEGRAFLRLDDHVRLQNRVAIPSLGAASQALPGAAASAKAWRRGESPWRRKRKCQAKNKPPPQLGGKPRVPWSGGLCYSTVSKGLESPGSITQRRIATKSS